MSITDDLLGYSLLDGTLLDSSNTRNGRIEVRQQNNYRWIQMGDKCIQSAMDLDKPSEIILPVYDWMLAVLLLTSEPNKVLNLGFGAGAFERFFWSHLPLVNVTSVEVSETLVACSRDYFYIPVNWPVEIELAEAYLRTNERKFDIVICDIFTSDYGCPDCLHEASFYSDISRAITETGVAVINIASVSEQELILLLQLMRRYFTWVTISLVPDHRNVILFLSKQPPPTEEEIILRVDDCRMRYKLDLAKQSKSLKFLPVLDV